MGELDLGHPARERLAQGLLAWGQPRPDIPPGLVARLRGTLDEELAEFGEALHEAAQDARNGRLLVTKTSLDRLACDGLARDPKPYEHTRANVRGTLTHAVIERDWDEGRARDAHEVVDAVWAHEASRSPGDPSSLSWWLNAQPPEAVSDLKHEVADLLAGYREVWPELPRERVVARVERPVELALADGRVVLRGVPDLVLDSPVRDSRARTLVVDLKTGRPRPEHDRHELRFYALLVTLATGRPPFRWATYYVTEGRAEHEDLRDETLYATVRRVSDGVRQQLRLAASADDAGLTIRAGAWCAFCARESWCEEAAAARARHGLSHPDDTMTP
jgi:RecB family exonuclease